MKRTTGKPNPGEANGQAKLTDAAVRAMRAEFDNGTRQYIIAAALQISSTTVHNVVRRKTWRHV